MSGCYLQEQDASGVHLQTKGAPVVDAGMLLLPQAGEPCYSSPVQRERDLRPGLPTWRGEIYHFNYSTRILLI
jgi:hypothetical protein